jgi:hypothetical protein
VESVARDPDNRIPGPDRFSRDRLVSLHHAHGAAGDVDLVLDVHAGHLCRLPADQRYPLITAGGHDSFDDARDSLRIEDASSNVIEHEEWRGAVAEYVVRAVRHDISTHHVPPAERGSDPGLGPDRIDRADEHGVAVPGQPEQSPEPIPRSEGAVDVRRPDTRAHPVEDGLLGVRVHPGVFIRGRNPGSGARHRRR